MFCQAPTPGQEWTSPTASEWELSRDALNVSILPMAMLSEEISLTEKSCWETSSSLESLAKSCLDFTFTSGLQHVLTVEPPLTDPCDVAYIPKRSHLKLVILQSGFTCHVYSWLRPHDCVGLQLSILNLRDLPHSFSPARNIFLVTEAKAEGGVGIFSGENFAFLGW